MTANFQPCGPRSARRSLMAQVRPVFLPIFLGLTYLIVSAAGAKDSDMQKPGQLFEIAKVWTFHLKFTPEQWEAMEPKGGGRGPFGGPGGPGGFGPAMFLAPTFLEQGDRNKDGKLSKDEFHGLAEKWFADWDKEKAGKLNADQVRNGLNSTLAPPTGPEPGGPGGGGGGRRMGMNLQGAEGARNGLASAAGIEFKYVQADLEFQGQLLKDVAVRYKGNGTWMQSRGSLKRSLKVDLNHFVKGQKLAGVSKLNLHNNVTDASWMNEVMSHRLFHDAGVPAPRTAYARVYVTVPGKYEKEYIGLYSLVEDIDKNFAEENFGGKKGAIFKPVTPNLFADLGDEWKNYNQTYDPKTELTPEQKQRIIGFCKLVTKADDAEFAAKLGEYIDLNEFARFMAVTVWLSTMDSILGMGQNFYVYLHPKTHKFQFMPWDLDHSFGQFGMTGSQEQRENLSIHKPWRGEVRFLERVFNVEAFKKLYLAKLDEFNKTIFKPERFLKQVDEIAAAIRPAVVEESEEKLARFDKVVAGESVEPARFGGFGGGRPGGDGQRTGRNEGGGGPRPGQGGGGEGPRFGGPGGFMQPAKPIKGFVKARAQSVIDQVAGRLEGETLSGFGPGGPGRGGGPGGRGGPGGPGGPGGFGPGMFLGRVIMETLDNNKDNEVSKQEFIDGFDKWFKSWDTDNSSSLDDVKLRAGINKDLSPFRGDGPPGFGPPPRE